MEYIPAKTIVTKTKAPAKWFGIDYNIQVFLGMEIRFPHDENDFLVYGITEELLRRYPWIYMDGLPDLVEIAKRENLYICLTGVPDLQ